jgi:hypothetical protein
VGFAEGYHGKVLPLETARQLVSINKEIRLENLEQVIPFEKARDIILKNPDHIAVIDCPCRKGMESPCLPLDVCMIIGNRCQLCWITADISRAITSAERSRSGTGSQRGMSHAFLRIPS